MSASTTTCPNCRQRSTWEDNPWRPFCSAQCRLIDLGEWLSDRYRLPAEPDSPPAFEDDMTRPRPY